MKGGETRKDKAATVKTAKGGLMTVRQFGDGWQVDFYAYGERIRKVLPTKRDATAYEGKIKAAIRENRFFDVKQDAFQVFKELSSWYLSLEDVKRKKSFERDERTIKKRLDPRFGNMPIKNLTPSVMNEYIAERLRTKSYRGGTIRPATVNREMILVKTMFNKAIRDGKLEKNPAKAVKHLKENNERERILSPEEWERYKLNCPSWYLPIATIAYFTAMRKGEIINLALPRVDLKNGFIRLRPEDTKTEYGRSIPVHPEVMEVLKKALKVRSLDIEKVFHRNGKPVTKSTVREAHESACRKAKIENFTFHDFRHTAINNWRKAGHDYFKIMAASGHRTVSVFKRYNMVDEGELQTLIYPESIVKKWSNPSENPSENLSFKEANLLK
jgi:integrase